jgi:hypothetical protein
VDDKRVRLVEQNDFMDIDENEMHQMDYESSQIDNDEQWFCFDDSTVTSVTREYIKKHYGSNDCAYMLFYRQKNRNKSNVDCSDSIYSISQWLLDEIAEKNRILQEKR